METLNRVQPDRVPVNFGDGILGLAERTVNRGGN